MERRIFSEGSQDSRIINFYNIFIQVSSEQIRAL